MINGMMIARIINTIESINIVYHKRKDVAAVAMKMSRRLKRKDCVLKRGQFFFLAAKDGL